MDVLRISTPPILPPGGGPVFDVQIPAPSFSTPATSAAGADAITIPPVLAGVSGQPTSVPSSPSTPPTAAQTPTTTPDPHASCDGHPSTAKTGGASASGGGPTAGAARGGASPFTFGLGLGTRSFNIHRPLTYRVGGATFSFPPVGHSNTSPAAPRIRWGKGWHATGGGHHRHVSGATATVTHQTRISLANPSRGRVVSTPYGRGVRLPDGSVTGVNRHGRAYVIAPDGRLRNLRPGVQHVGSMPIRVFTATVIDVRRADGTEARYDSRGNVRVRGGASALGGGPSSAIAGAGSLAPPPVTGTVRPTAQASGGGPAGPTGPAPGKGVPNAEHDDIDDLMHRAMDLIGEIMTTLQTETGLGAGGASALGGGGTGLLGGKGGLGGIDDLLGGLGLL